MKKSMILVMAAAAAALTLVSCTKELNGNNEENNQTSGLRTLTISFAPNTRTTLDGLQPKWSENDKILLADGTNEMETHIVSAAEAGTTSFEITTSLTGTITAVYPSAAAATSGNSITGINVSNAPDGNFASANICMATAAASEKELTFENQTAVFEVSVPSGTKQLTVTSLKPVGTTGQRTGTPVNIAESSATITVGNNTADIPNPCYISVLPGTVLLQDLNFDTGSAQGGFSPNYIKGKDKTPSSYAVEVNTMYTLEATSLHAYVTVDGKKWATMNVGATSETDNGLHFAWGDVTGQKLTGSTFSPGFSWSNCPLSDGLYVPYNHTNSFTKYTGSKNEYAISGTADNKTKLDLEDDAAFANWGGAWHMPEQTDFSSLINTTGTTKSNFLNNVLTIKGTSLQFPAAGYGDATESQMSARGYYWSSSLSNDYTHGALRLNFHSNTVNLSDLASRYYGSSVRPVSE